MGIKMSEKITIIVPVYNTELYLNKCIDSILNQTYKNIEVICVNDGSTDKSLEILEKYNDERLKIITIENHGVSYARNLALENVTGDYIAFVDSDDNIKETYCEDLLNNIIKNNSDLSYCGHNTKNIGGKLLKQWTPEILQTNTPIDDRLKITKFLVVTKKLFKTSIIKENNIRFNIELHYAEDSLFLIQYLTHCKNVSGVDKILYTDMVNEKSLCRNPKYRLRRRIERDKSFKIIADIIKEYKQKNIIKPKKKYRYAY